MFRRSFFVMIMIFACIVASCTKETAKQEVTPVQEQENIESTDNSKTKLIAQCIYLEGSVEVGTDGAFKNLDVGDTVELGQIIRTGKDSSCEIRFGKIASLFVRENTIVEVNNSKLSSSQSSVDAKLISGEILNKIAVLGGNDSYSVRTGDGICGVRGTEFIVSSKNGASIVAVRSGTVAIIPENPIVNSIANAAVNNKLASVAMGIITEASYQVKEGQEFEITKEVSSSAEKAYKEIANELGITSGSGESVLSINSYKDVSTQGLDMSKLEKIQKSADSIKSKSLLVQSASENAKALFGAFDYIELPSSDSKQSDKSSINNLPSLEKQNLVGKSNSETEQGSVVQQTATEASRKSSEELVQGPLSSEKAKVQALVGSYTIGRSAIGGNIIKLNDSNNFIVSDENGSLRAISMEGKELWSSESFSADSALLVSQFKGNIYYKDGARVIAVEANTGRKVFTIQGDVKTLLSDSSVVQFPDSIIVSTSQGFNAYNDENGSLKLSVAVPDGNMMNPSNYNSYAALVNRKGILMLIDTNTGKVLKSLQTNASEVTTKSVRIVGDKASFCDSNGLVTLVDLNKMKILWETNIGSSNSRSAIEMNESSIFVYLYDKNKVYCLNIDGKTVNGTISNVSAPPLLVRGVLYFGSKDGSFVAYDVSHSKEIGRISLGSVASSRPLFTNGFIYVGTLSGKLIKIDPSLL